MDNFSNILRNYYGGVYDPPTHLSRSSESLLRQLSLTTRNLPNNIAISNSGMLEVPFMGFTEYLSNEVLDASKGSRRRRIKKLAVFRYPLVVEGAYLTVASLAYDDGPYACCGLPPLKPPQVSCSFDDSRTAMKNPVQTTAVEEASMVRRLDG